MEPIEILKDALEVLTPIPSKNFITNYFTNKEDSCCVIGHYTRLKSVNPEDYSKKNCDDWFECPLREITDSLGINIAAINNDIEEESGYPYNQKTPKARSLAAIKDCIKKLEKKV